MSQVTALDQLKQFTTVVADTGDFQSIRAYTQEDATTNPTLIYKAVQQSEYKHLLEKAIADNKASTLTGPALHRKVIDDLLIAFGREILSIVPGRVSTEVDARLSFDIKGTVDKARYLIGLYEKQALIVNASLSRSPRPGKAPKLPRLAKRKASTATSRFSLLSPKQSRAQRQECASSHHLSAVSTITTKPRPAKTTKAPRIPAFNPSNASSLTTRNSATTPKSWVQASAIQAKSATWQDAIC